MPEDDKLWTTTHSAEAELPASAIWSAWSEISRWPQWNTDIEQVKIGGPFEVGSVITMTPQGQDPVRLRIAEMTPGELFMDEADVGGTLIRTCHRVEQVLPERIRVSYELEARGSLASQLGPAISADFADVIAALIAYAARAHT